MIGASAGDPARRHGTKVLRIVESEALLLRTLYNRSGQRVFTVLLQ